MRGGFFEYDASSKRPSLSPPHSFSPCCRFVDANSYDWGGSVVPSAVDDEKNDFDYFDGLPYSTSGGEGAGGMTTDCGTNYNKPGVVVKRDDVAGYIIIDKPPNVPVHARVDNRLENVASCVGRMLWMERRRRRLDIVDGGGIPGRRRTAKKGGKEGESAKAKGRAPGVRGHTPAVGPEHVRPSRGGDEEVVRVLFRWTS